MRKTLNTIFGLCFLAVIGWLVFIYATAEARVSEVCSRIDEGMPVQEANKLIADNGLRPPLKSSGISQIAEGKTFGRYGCKVVALDGIVKSSDYAFAD
jgi:hypothetical protein